jgi:hypothetical protein
MKSKKIEKSSKASFFLVEPKNNEIDLKLLALVAHKPSADKGHLVLFILVQVQVRHRRRDPEGLRQLHV